MANLEYLKCFMVMAETLSFTETSRRLKISQPSVTRQIQRLEAELGLQLFVRDRHHVRLSKDGAGLRARLSSHLSALEQALDLSRDEAGREQGTLSVGCLSEIGQHLISELLVRFQEEHPGFDLRIRFLANHEIVRGVRDGELDMGITSRLVLGEAVRAHRLLEERIDLVTRASNRAPVAQGSAFVGYYEEDALLLECLKAELPRADLSRLGRLTTVNSHRSMIRFLLSRDSYAALPHFSIREELEGRKLRIASKKPIRNTLYLIQPDTERVPRRHALLRDYLFAQCRKRALE